MVIFVFIYLFYQVCSQVVSDLAQVFCLIITIVVVLSQNFLEFQKEIQFLKFYWPLSLLEETILYK